MYNRHRERFFESAKKTEEERLRELDEQIEKIKARKQQLESQMREKERKARTKRLIEVGAIFEKYFDIVGEDQAEQIAYGMKELVEKHKEKLLDIDVEKSKEADKIIYKTNKKEQTI
ncbi:hypothetical protein ABET41_12560 [Metabacillus fastidiosus]|uniref:Uncharacterized protein n=1 Tax=Metabacillus fastidiosus TaxID=1458 RepID=A0ABU6NZY7_9BACI|nr:hypothetical protein [Metabacillus fastidiosus]MED4402243.1 hypothetical protein [Metabacillus fastidiosus]MED4462114.1 hypothetical protein [Metabacillus fastidiosus]